MSEEAPRKKLPFRRLQRPLEQLTDVALPFHTQLLGQKSAALERLKGEGGAGGQLRLEQTRACKTVQLLKADLFELEQLNLQVREEDQDAFHHKVQLPLKNAVETLSNFMSLHSDVLGPCLSIDSDSLSSAPADFPGIVCDPNAPAEEEDLTQLQLQQEPGEQQQQLEPQATGAWSRLRSELLEIHSLVLKFSALVFAQQGAVDTVQGNVQLTAANVKEGTEQLRKASLLRAATFPVVGALVGGLLLGPVGAVAGLKLAGCAACAAGGTALGYTAGSKLKQRHQAGLQAITYPARTKSESDLSLATEKS